MNSNHTGDLNVKSETAQKLEDNLDVFLYIIRRKIKDKWKLEKCYNITNSLSPILFNIVLAALAMAIGEEKKKEKESR